MQRMMLALRKILGLNNKLPEFDLSKTEFIGRTAFTDAFLTEAENLDITDSFHIRRRQGVTKKVTGDIHSLWSDGEICLYREGEYLKRMLPDYTSSTLRSGLTTKKIRMDFLSLIGKVYYSDGYATGIVENGMSRSWGLETPYSPRYIVSTGIMKEGNYKIAYTFVRENGLISGSNIPDKVTLTNNSSIQISDIQVSTDSTVKYIDIYITHPNGEALYLYNRISNGTTSVNINSNNVKAGLPLRVIRFSKPPAGTLLEYYNGRIYIVSGNVIYYTEPFAYELINPRTNHIMFEENVTLIGAVKDGLWVTTDRTYFAKGDNPPFEFDEKAKYGAIIGTKQVISGDYIGEGTGSEVVLWTSINGICAGMTGGNFKNLTENNYSFPMGKMGTSLFIQRRGINQYLVSFKDATGAENIYETSDMSMILTLPMLELIASGTIT
jgi:hypothetical protein